MGDLGRASDLPSDRGISGEGVPQTLFGGGGTRIVQLTYFNPERHDVSVGDFLGLGETQWISAGKTEGLIVLCGQDALMVVRPHDGARLTVVFEDEEGIAYAEDGTYTGRADMADRHLACREGENLKTAVMSVPSEHPELFRPKLVEEFLAGAR